MKNGYKTLEKAEENRKKWNEIVKRTNKSEELKSEIKNINTLWVARKVIKAFNDYSKILSEAKYKIKHVEGLKILTLKEMFQRLSIAITQVKAAIFMNSKNSKTPDPYRLLLNLTYKKILKRNDKDVALSNLSI